MVCERGETAHCNSGLDGQQQRGTRAKSQEQRPTDERARRKPSQAKGTSGKAKPRALAKPSQERSPIQAERL